MSSFAGLVLLACGFGLGFLYACNVARTMIATGRMSQIIEEWGGSDERQP